MTLTVGTRAMYISTMVWYRIAVKESFIIVKKVESSPVLSSCIARLDAFVDIAGLCLLETTTKCCTIGNIYCHWSGREELAQSATQKLAKIQ